MEICGLTMSLILQRNEVTNMGTLFSFDLHTGDTESLD